VQVLNCLLFHFYRILQFLCLILNRRIVLDNRMDLLSFGIIIYLKI